MNVQLTLKSGNAKVGPIPVSITSEDSCPTTCPLRGAGCYAESGFISWAWAKVSDGRWGGNWQTFVKRIKALPDGQLWRHNQAGDLPRKGRKIQTGYLTSLVNANIGKRGFTYTHHDMSVAANRDAVKNANDKGFTVNLSANNLAQADVYKALGIAPVVTILPINQMTNTVTPNGTTVVICPAITCDNVTCESCKLCQWKDRDVIIGFPAHGGGKKKAELVTIQ